MFDDAHSTASPARRASRLWAVLLAAFVVAPLATIGISSTRLFRPAGSVLEVEMQASAGNFAQIYWSDSYAIDGHDSSLVLLHRRPGEFERVRFALPSKPLEILRFDPIDGAGEVIIRGMRVLDQEGRTVRTIDPLVMMPLYQVALFVPRGTDAQLVTTPGANDPMMTMRSSWLAMPPRWHSLQFVTPVSLVAIALAVAVLIAVSIAMVVRDVMAGPIAIRHVLWFAALFTGVVWANVALIHRYPVPVPFWDQWDGEAATLYIPLPYNGVSWRQMFALHNEHRIFFSRLLALVLVKLNGQWDPHLQIVVNAVLHALGAFVFAAILWLAASRRVLPVVVAVVGLACAAPFALENSLSGFQSSFYFLILFSLLALWLLNAHPPESMSWWMGALCALCCPFTVAGGIFIAVAIAAMAVLTSIARGRLTWHAIATFGVLGVVGGLGYAALPPPIPYHEELKAASSNAFFTALGRNLAFPWIANAIAGPIVWLPWIALPAVVVRRRLRTTVLERIAVSLGLWVIVQAIAIAYLRGSIGLTPAPRYLDVLSVGFIVNTIAVASLVEEARGEALRRFGYGALAVWLLVGTSQIAWLSAEMVGTAAVERRQWTRHHLTNVREFMRSGDLDAFLHLRGPLEVPYHSAALLAGWLQNPGIASILPAAIRQPIALQPADDASRSAAAVVASPRSSVRSVFDSYDRKPSAGSVRFESQPVECRTSKYLRMEISSSESWSGLRLSLRRPDSGQEIIIRPPRSATGWTSVFARCPDGPFTVVAADESPTNWLAFREPAEVGWGSMTVERLIQRSAALGLVVIGLIAAALASTWWPGGRQESGVTRGEPTSETDAAT